MNPIIISTTLLALCLPSIANEANDRGEAEHRPPPNPIFEALDQNGDHLLSAEEIAQAAVVLQQFDRNQDGQLEPRELRPRHPRGDHAPEGGEGQDHRPPHPPREHRR